MNFSVVSRNEVVKRWEEAQKLPTNSRKAQLRILADLTASTPKELLEFLSDDEEDDVTPMEKPFEIPRPYIMAIFAEYQAELKRQKNSIVAKRSVLKSQSDKLTEEINEIDEYLKGFMINDTFKITGGTR